MGIVEGPAMFDNSEDQRRILPSDRHLIVFPLIAVTGQIVDRSAEGRSHLEKILSRESLSKKDRKTARTLIKQLQRAILEWEGKV